MRRGDVVVDRGVRLGAAQLAAIAAAGRPEVQAARRPRAAVLATGSELRPPGEPLEPGQIYEANSVLLEAQLASCGAVVERLSSVEDDADAHREALARGLEADVLVTSGGVSVGPHDLVRGTLAELGVEEVFWGVAVKPGKPISFGVAGRRLVFGLPGNPVSVLVGFELFVRPALLALQGVGDPLPRFEHGTLGSALRRSPGRDELVRARLRPGRAGVVVEPLAGRESHMIARAAVADALAFIERGDGSLAEGEAVQFLRL
jgi:molybdopterin molybdotransferase